HFFLTYERTQQVTGATTTQTAPTLRQRTGDFSDTRAANGPVIPIYDPATTQGRTRQPFPGNVIPTNRIDTVSRAIAAYWLEPDRPGTVTGANNYSQNTRPSLDRDIVVSRFDHQFNSSNQVMARYFISDSRNLNPGIYPETVLPADSSISSTDQRVQNILGTWTHTFRSNLLNEFRGGLVRRDYHLQRLGTGSNFAGKLGLKGVSEAAF